MKTIERGMKTLRDRIHLLVGRAVLAAVDDAGKRQRVQFSALKGEVKDGVERVQQYGFTSVPLAGAQVVFVAFGGNRDHPVALAVDDPRYRKGGLQPGEVALYNHEGTCIVLKLGNELEITAATKVRFNTPVLEVTGNIIDQVDTGGQSMADMRAVYNSHQHDENDSGGPTEEPNEQMGGGA